MSNKLYSEPGPGPTRSTRGKCIAALGRLLLLALLPAAIVPAVAGQTRVVDLYSAEVAVASRAAAERRKAAASGLQIVYNRITGSALAVSEYPELRNSLARAERMVSGYQYQQGSGDDAAAPLVLQFSFAAEAVGAALDRAGAPQWSARRPLAELWLVEQQGNQKRFVTARSNPELYSALVDEARKFGIPISLPAAEGDQRLSSRRAWQQNDSDVIEAATRGGAGIALVGRVASGGSGWRGQWKIYSNGEIRSRRIDAASASEVASAGLAPLASSLAQRFAVRGGAAQIASGYTLTVEGLRNERDYLSLVAALQDIAGIKDLQLLEISDDRCRFSFAFNGPPDRARALLGLNSGLVHSGIGDELLFAWRR